MKYADNPEIAKKYHSARWKQLRQIKLKQVGGLCERCRKKGIFNSAYIIHHKDYVTDKNYEDDNVFYNIDNLEAVCFDCHNKEHFEAECEYEFDINGNVIKKE